MSFVLTNYPTEEIMECLEMFIETGLWNDDFEIFKWNIQKKFKKIIAKYHSDKTSRIANPLDKLLSDYYMSTLMKCRSHGSNENYTEESLKELHEDLVYAKIYSKFSTKIMKKLVMDNNELDKYLRDHVKNMRREEEKHVKEQRKKRSEELRQKQLQKEEEERTTKKRRLEDDLFRKEVERVKKEMYGKKDSPPKKSWYSYFG